MSSDFITPPLSIPTAINTDEQSRSEAETSQPHTKADAAGERDGDRQTVT